MLAVSPVKGQSHPTASLQDGPQAGKPSDRRREILDSPQMSKKKGILQILPFGLATDSELQQKLYGSVALLSSI